MGDLAAAFANAEWHEGEIAIQRHAGVAMMMAPVAAQVMNGHLTAQHRSFYPKLPFIVAGVVDPAGDAWATMLVGEPGFMQAHDPRALQVTATIPSADPARAGLLDGAAVGLIGIELPTRRRNRLNGPMRWVDETTFAVEVGQAYGNCPQYIRQRDHHFVRDPARPYDEPAMELPRIEGRAAEIIAAAEILFVVSYLDRPDAGRQVDASHKGGRAGFVGIGDDGVLTIPDFAGNLYFNTLGNILLNPRCGLLFVDFDTGDVLQVSGDGEVVLEGPEIAAFQGAERLFRIRPRRIVLRPGALPLRWDSPVQGVSANATATGTWREAAARLRAREVGDRWRPFRIARIVDESSVIRSLYLEPMDSAGLTPHAAGQHLPIRLAGPDGTAIVRTYTLSSAASDNVYRLSIKRDGKASRLMHQLSVGDPIEARSPAGSFTIDAQARHPAILLAAGVGVTPMVAMLRHLVYEGRRTRYLRQAWLLYSARTKAERAFDEELTALAVSTGGGVAVTRALSDTSSAGPEDFEIAGRLSADLLKGAGALHLFDYYVCGPAGFTQDMYDGLRALGVPDDRIFAEAFGPSALLRERDAGRSVAPVLPRSTEPVEVVFSSSGRRARWTPADGTLLEFAEQLGLDAPSSCRAGSCGTCRTGLLAGAVSYEPAPTTDVGEHEVLVCCARPAAGESELVLNL
jgi:hypothetical protein